MRGGSRDSGEDPDRGRSLIRVVGHKTRSEIEIEVEQADDMTKNTYDENKEGDYDDNETM